MQTDRPSSRKRIGLIGFDGVAALDLVGVLDAFHNAAGGDWRTPGPRYETVLVGLSAAPFRTESGVRLLPDVTADAAPAFDTIVVPGGAGLREPETNAAVAAWLRQRAGGARRLVSVCTGLYGMAAAGLMDGRRATTHWFHAADAARRFPRVRIEADAIFIRDGALYSSAGMTAGIDLALALIEEDYGPALSLQVARQLVVYVRRTGGQLQYSEPLRAQTLAGNRFAELAAAVTADPGGDWTVEAMAARTGLGGRQFSRRFKAAFATAPGQWLDKVRLDEARRRLAASNEGLERVAHAIGFGSGDAFRRAFERRFGINPSVWRDRFTPHHSGSNDHETPRHP